MRLTNDDKDILRRFGHEDKDFAQIERAMEKRYTTYRLNVTPVTREDAILLLGRIRYLAGIARSAFHYTACQECPGLGFMYFDSRKLFKEE